MRNLFYLMRCIDPVERPFMSTALTHSNIKACQLTKFFLAPLLTVLILTLLDTGYPLSFVLNCIFIFFFDNIRHSINNNFMVHVIHPTKMRRYNMVPLILLILSIIKFALAAPIPEKCQACVDVMHVPKDVITVLGKRGDRLEEMVKLFENFDSWWGRNPGSSSAVGPSSSSAPLESGHGSTQVHVPPASPTSSTESDWDPESLVWHPPTDPPTPSIASSTESDSEHESTQSSVSVSDLDRGSVDVDHDAPPPSPESSIESVHSHTLPSSPEWSAESEHWYTPPSSPGSDLVSDH